MDIEQAKIQYVKEKALNATVSYNHSKMINFDSITKKAFKNIIQIGHKALVIFTEHQHFQAKDLEKQMYYVI